MKQVNIYLGGKINNMPVIDTVVIFAAADTKDKYHKIGLKYLQGVNEGLYFMPSFALMEFDIILKSKGYSFEERMEKYALFISDFPKIEKYIIEITPLTLYNLARFEYRYNLDYFDAAICAQSLQVDGIVITPDKEIKEVDEIETIWD